MAWTKGDCHNCSPLFVFLLLINSAAAAVTITMGWWLIMGYYNLYDANLLDKEASGYKGHFSEDRQYQVDLAMWGLATIGISIIVAAVFSFSWNVLDILILIVPCISRSGKPCYGFPCGCMQCHNCLRTNLANVEPIESFKKRVHLYP